MPRRKRPKETTRSEHWLRVAVNDATTFFDKVILSHIKDPDTKQIQWQSPLRSDGFAEYYDDAFLEKLGIKSLKVPLHDFWPAGGPRWDGLARTDDGKVILVEAKAYIEESVDYRSHAGDKSMELIRKSLAEAKDAFSATQDANWESPFYQYANRLAHLYFLKGLNDIDAYLAFVYFAGADDVPSPCTTEQWKGAIRLTKKCLGIGKHRYPGRVLDIIVNIHDI